MQVQLQLVRVHEPAAVREILTEAFGIAGETNAEGAEWIAVFEKAVDLLAARIPIMPQAPVSLGPVDLSGLRRHN